MCDKLPLESSPTISDDRNVASWTENPTKSTTITTSTTTNHNKKYNDNDTSSIQPLDTNSTTSTNSTQSNTTMNDQDYYNQAIQARNSINNNEKSVAELKQWLAEFGKKNQQHFVQGKLDARGRKIKTKIHEIEMKLRTHSPCPSDVRGPETTALRGAAETEKWSAEKSPRNFQPPLSVTIPDQGEDNISETHSSSWGDFEPDFPSSGSEPPTPITHMHSTNLFQDKTLTVDSLDLICNGFMKKSKYPPESPTKSETGTASLTSEDSELPAVNADAVDSKLAHVFSPAGGGEVKGAIFRRGKQPLEQPKQQQQRQPPSPASSTTKESGKENEEENRRLKSRGRVVVAKVAVTKAFQQRKSGETSPPPPSSAVGLKAKQLKFGNAETSRSPPAVRNGVAQKQEELQRLFAQNKAPKVVTKVKWHVDAKSGTYKKKVTLENLE